MRVELGGINPQTRRPVDEGGGVGHGGHGCSKHIVTECVAFSSVDKEKHSACLGLQDTRPERDLENVKSQSQVSTVASCVFL